MAQAKVKAKAEVRVKAKANPGTGRGGKACLFLVARAARAGSLLLVN